METKELGAYTRSFGVSFSIVSLLSALLVVVKETNEDTVLAFMKAVTGHHWVTHGLFDVIVFLVLGWVLAKINNGQGVTMAAGSLVNLILGSVVLSGLIIVIFYLA